MHGGCPSRCRPYPGEVVVLAGLIPCVPVGRLDGPALDLPSVVPAGVVAVDVLAPLADIPVALVEAGLLDEVLLALGTQAASLEIVVTVELGDFVDPKKRVGGSFVSTVPLTRELILA